METSQYSATFLQQLPLGTSSLNTIKQVKLHFGTLEKWLLKGFGCYGKVTVCGGSTVYVLRIGFSTVLNFNTIFIALCLCMHITEKKSNNSKKYRIFVCLSQFCWIILKVTIYCIYKWVNKWILSIVGQQSHYSTSDRHSVVCCCCSCKQTSLIVQRTL